MQSIKEYVQNKKVEIKTYIDNLIKKPTMVVVQVGNVEASNRYVKNKLKDAEELGIQCKLEHYDETITEEELLRVVEELNIDPTVTGYIVQLPLPKHISETKVKLAIDPAKDADGFHPLSKLNPATPQGILDYLEAQNFEFEDKKAVVIGRSDIVGKPMARMLLEKNCNVTQIHSKTSYNSKIEALKNAELVVVATGHRNTLTDGDLQYTKICCFVVDVGINFNEQGKLCGDCENVTIRAKTPCPNGCGLTTRLALFTNLIKLYENQNSSK